MARTDRQSGILSKDCTCIDDVTTRSTPQTATSSDTYRRTAAQGVSRCRCSAVFRSMTEDVSVHVVDVIGSVQVHLVRQFTTECSTTRRCQCCASIQAMILNRNAASSSAYCTAHPATHSVFLAVLSYRQLARRRGRGCFGSSGHHMRAKMHVVRPSRKDGSPLRHTPTAIRQRTNSTSAGRCQLRAWLTRLMTVEAKSNNEKEE